MKKFLFGTLITLACWACTQSEPPKKILVDVAGIDESTKPGDNFFRHVNGLWYDTARIAADQSGVGSYSFLNIPQKKLLQNILDNVSKMENSKGTIEQKVGDFYASGMDMETINERGYEPIKPLLERIEAIQNVPALMKLVANELKMGNRSIISFGIRPDNKNSGINIAHVYQTGIGLPDRDYFFKTDSSTLRIQEAYKKYLAALFQLTGSDPAAATQAATIVYNLEKEIAASHKTRVEMRDVNNNYNKVSVAALDKKQPHIGWTTLLTTLEAKTDSIDMPQPAYYDKLNGMLKTTSLSDWKVYLKAGSMRTYANVLSQPFVDAAFEFSKVLSGQATQKSHEQIMTENVDGLLGQALGQLYVKKYFNEDAKKRVLDLVNNLQKSFENRINNLDWMSDSTKQKAKEKLYAITKKIGYPDVWREYDVTIERDSYFENILTLNQNDFQYRLAKLNKPVDKTEWGTSPSTVTAYYNPSNNEIAFPAGILQFPYFDFYADDALNYG
ncbi:MAG: M13 family metallopeptidase, partial [Cyclobacteriaceae bacterium]|nr:M13 family metallopeptidase [Cyclobacteriaceae bacterium]